MTDDPFLRAILDAPDDDLPRLVYADWLDERGESERAEFIRVQVELSRLSMPASKTFRPIFPKVSYHKGEGVCDRCTDDVECHWHALSKRERELLAAPGRTFNTNENEWLAESVVDWWPWVTPAGAARANAWQFRRGFVSEITLTAADWLAHGDAILAAYPVRGKWYDDEPHYREFSRDGLVRLTTWPETRYDDPQDPVRICLPSRPWREVGRVDETDHRGRVLRLFAAEWPGVRFELPPAGQYTTAASWSAGANPLADIRRVMRAMERTHELSTEGD